MLYILKWGHCVVHPCWYCVLAYGHHSHALMLKWSHVLIISGTLSRIWILRVDVPHKGTMKADRKMCWLKMNVFFVPCSPPSLLPDGNSPGLRISHPHRAWHIGESCTCRTPSSTPVESGHTEDWEAEHPSRTPLLLTWENTVWDPYCWLCSASPEDQRGRHVARQPV